MLNPSRWARHSEWNIIVVKVNFWTHFCIFVGDVTGWIIYYSFIIINLLIYLLIYLFIIYLLFHSFIYLSIYLFIYFFGGENGQLNMINFYYMPINDSISQSIQGLILCLDVCLYGIRSANSDDNLLGIESTLLSNMFYSMWHLPSGPQYS